ncbi:MAG: MG2 domain-containing protein [Alphaproteobacteria bacterium]
MRVVIATLGFLLWAGAAVAAFDSADSKAEAGKPLEILRVTPDGEDVPAGKQVVIEFNRPVVPVGRMERTAAELPIIVTPALKCEWRWINTSSLACNLPDAAPLQPATRYTLDIKPGIKAEDGATTADTYHQVFVTERPRIDEQEFHLWKSAARPVLRVVFNQPVDKSSVEEHVFLGVGDQGQDRVNLSVKPDPSDNTPPQLIPVPGEKYALLFRKVAPRKSDDQATTSHGQEARRIWLVEPLQDLPGDTHVILKSEAGLRSALGPEAGIEAGDLVAFDTYPAFRFLGVSCASLDDQPIDIAPSQSPKGKCDPMQPIRLNFSAPVDRASFGSVTKATPPIGGWKQDAEEEADDESDGDSQPQIGWQYRRTHDKGQTYSIYLPPGLKAAQDYLLQSRAASMNLFARIVYRVHSWFAPMPSIDVHDIFGRHLRNSFDARFATDHRSPNYVLDYTDAVLEKNVDSEVPFYVNNLTRYHFDYRRLTAAGATDGQHFSKDLPAVKDIQYAVPFGVRDMLGGASGAVFGTLLTEPSLPHLSEPPTLFAQVTPYQAHLKLGHFSSIVWVTDMADGKPVAGARVSIYRDGFYTLQAPKRVDAAATTGADGIAVLPGTETLDPDLTLTRVYDKHDTRYFVRIQKGADLALLPVSGSFEIDSYRASGSESVYPSYKERYGHMRAWGTTAQGIYRAGDTIQYKIYVRNQNDDGFVPPPLKGYRLKVVDPMGKTVFEKKPVTLSAFGGTDGEFTVPKDGAVGWYKFELSADFAHRSEGDDSADDEGNGDNAGGDDHSSDKKLFVPMRVLVSDFTPSPFHVSNQLNGDLFRAGEKVQVDTHAELHSGGAYTDANARITALLDSAPFVSKNPLAQGFQFDSFQNETASQQLYQENNRIDDKGALALSFDTGKPDVVYGKLTVESAVADDRGKYVTAQARADYLGVDRLVGLKSRDWLFTVGKAATVDYLVVDEHGNPAKGTAVAVAVEHQVTKSARVKGAGNAYLTEYHTDWESAGGCKGISEDAPTACSFTPAKAGTYRLTAKIKDTKGRDHQTVLSSYAMGPEFVSWNDENDNSLTIVPERTDYKIGDTARYLVKNPYPGAEALITIERYGVIDRFVQRFDSSTPIVTFPVKPEYLPGFYLSVTVVSPRVEKPLGEGQVDLGKPTFRMGYVGVPVSDPYKEMLVTAKADRPVYKPRDPVTVTLHAQPRVAGAKHEPVELTVAVLDESVFDLVAGGRSYFDPYAGFYKLDSLDLRNYSLLTRLIGRQKFEKKGANPGGDGGSDLAMRSLFKFVSYWNGSLKTDANGNATIHFEAPDNLTGWHVLAIATTPGDRFGLGDGNFKVNRPTEVRPVMPNQVMEGDRFDAAFSVMNRTDKPRTLDVDIVAEGNIDAARTPAHLMRRVTLAPYKRATVSMPVQTTAVAQTREVAQGALHFTVTAGDATDRDGLLHTLPVLKNRSLEVAADYGTTTQDRIDVPIAFPKTMLPDVGSVSVALSPTVIGNIAGAFGYMRDYPYLCWEQKLSKGVMAAQYKQLHAYLPADLAWEGSDALPQATLDEAASFQAPNGGMAYFQAEDQYVDPYLSAYTALAFHWLRADGYHVPEEVETRLDSYLNTLLQNDAVPDFYSEGMTSTVRAVALAALAQDGKLALSDLERYAPHAKNMSLFGKSYFLQAALNVKGGEKYAPDVAKMILAASNETGGKFVFNETLDDSYARILASPVREQCAVLDAFTAYGERPAGAKLVGDVPFKLLRTITQDRGSRDHWENTQENLFCMNALVDYARIYEKVKPDMTVTASLGGDAFGKASFHDLRDPAATLERPVKQGDAGHTAPLALARDGKGRFYYAARLSYALPPAETHAADAGIEIHREYSVQRGKDWVLLKPTDGVKRGDLVRVDLFVSVPAARNFVVVDDPVPGGLEPVNRDLATSSEVDAREGDFKAAGGSLWFKFSDWIDFAVSRWSFYHEELRHDSARFYSDYLPPGNYHLSYTAQAIATGSFGARPSMASEMYEPDVYGKTEAATLGVTEPDAKP